MSDSTAPWEDYSAAPTATAGPWSDYAAAPEPTYDATLFKQRVGRDPEPAELANFKASKGVGWAGDPMQGRFTAGQAAVGGLEDTASVGTGVIASVPTAGAYMLGALGLTGNTAKEAAQATQNALTYQPRTEAGQAGMQTIGQIASGPTETAARVADLMDPSGLSGDTVRDVSQRVGYVAPLLGAPSLVRGVAKAGSAVYNGARGAVSRELASARAPVGVEYDTAGNPLPPNAPKPTYDSGGNAVPPAAPAPSSANVIGASATNPPTFEQSPPASSASGSDTTTTETAAPVTSRASQPPANLPTPPTGPLPAAAQTSRAATLRAIGLDEARESAITGDRKAAATDYQQSKIDGDGGKTLSDAFQKERDALQGYSDRLVADTGGSTGLDETSLHNRGSTILQPLESLSDHIDAETRALYQRADAQAQGMPLELTNTARVLADRPAFIGTSDGQQLLRGVNAYLRQAGIADDAGTIGTASVQQAERLKQYLNDQWTPRTARLIRSIKDSIDDDVTTSAGGDVYAQARAMRTLRANLLDNPQGVSSLLESSGPNGINRPVNVERVPDTVARMPVDQFQHVVSTLNCVATDIPSIAPQARAALGEIRAQFALRLQEQAQKFKGAWNNRGVTQYLNQNSAKLAQVFSPAELGRLHTLNRAGNILDVDRTYPGAAVQGHNLAVRGALGAIEHGAGAVGAHLAGPAGALAGEIVGHAATRAIGGSLSRKAARARIRKL